jgi:putative spermidine/putrescine transport system substrate-binding protein
MRRVQTLAVFVAVLLGGLWLAGVDVSAQQRETKFAGQTLRAAMWGGTWADAIKKTVAQRFEAQTGAKVTYVLGNPTDYATQLIAARGANVPFDVAYWDPGTQTDLVQQGLLDKVDTQAVPLATDPKGFKPLNPGYSPGAHLYYLGIAYNTKKFEELGLKPPSSWNDFWNPKLAGRVSVPDITTSMGMSMIASGAAVAGKRWYDVDAGVKKLSELKLYSVYKSSSQMQNDFAAGNIWAAAATDGRAWQLTDGGKPVSFVVPTVPGTNRPGWVEFMFIDVVKGTPKPELAKIFQRIAHGADIQVAMANETSYSPMLRTAVEQLYRENPGKWKHRWPTPDVWDQVEVVDWSVALPLMPRAVDLFNRQLAR